MTNCRHLHIDIETYSETPIADCGLYRYAEDPAFRILLAAYSWEGEETQIIDLSSGESLPAWFVDALTDPRVVKHAHNATFERVCFSHHLFRNHLWEGCGSFFLDPEQWDCSMVQAARCGLPLSLKQVGEALRFDKQKMDEGKDLIKLFCTPHPEMAGQIGMDGNRVTPGMLPDKWETFKRYCVRDVDVEKEICEALSWYQVSDFERGLYAVDQRINDRGVLIDFDFATKANRLDSIHKARLSEEAMQLTGLSNPNSVSQLRGWVSEQLGEEFVTFDKQTIKDLMQRDGLPSDVRRVLQIRAEMGKTSNAKYQTMLDVMGLDGRARGLTQFYGTRTGRWAGRLIQMQNLPQNHIGALDDARKLVKADDVATLDLCFGNIPDTLSQLIRTAFVARSGMTFAVCDFSAIEARVLAWLAGEEWVLDVFRKGGDIYCATASQMFHVPVEKHGQNSHLRQKGKVAVLALGYQGGVGALDKMGGSRMGMTEEEESETVVKWRQANPHIVAFWSDVETAAKNVVSTGKPVTVHGLTFRMEGPQQTVMTIELPSGRRICYQDMTFGYSAKDRKQSLQFHTLDQTTHKWVWVPTYGGKLTENITQATARDCLAETMVKCEAKGFDVCFHIHDELVMEVRDPKALDAVQEIFKENAPWNEGLPLKGAGYCTPYYLKD